MKNGEVEISNNFAENAIRPFVVGRKNWLFSDTVKGAKSSAIIYSLIETAKANGVEPYAYLMLVLTDMQDMGRPRKQNKTGTVNRRIRITHKSQALGFSAEGSICV